MLIKEPLIEVRDFLILVKIAVITTWVLGTLMYFFYEKKAQQRVYDSKIIIFIILIGILIALCLILNLQ